MRAATVQRLVRRRLTNLALGCATALLLLVRPAAAATPEEDRAYGAVVKMFQDGLFEVVDREAAGFATNFVGSARLGEVSLLQAQARLRLKQYDAALTLLNERAPGAGPLADEYAFWQAMVRLERGEQSAAADAFTAMAAAHPSSARRAQALYRAALARMQLGDNPAAIDLLRAPEGAFQQAVKAQPGDEWTARGLLLLADLLLRSGDAPAASEALKTMTGWSLTPPLAWKQRFVLARLDFAGQRFAEALSAATNLVVSATNVVTPDLLAEAVLLQGDASDRLGQPDAASRAYEINLTPAVPAPLRRLALQRVVELNLRRGNLPEAISRLEAFTVQFPQDESLDAVRLWLGEVRLRKSQALAVAAATNAEVAVTRFAALQQARSDFDRVITNHAQSALVGRAHLGRGWSYWEEGTNSVPNALTAFQAAATHLQRSADQAVARFKLADCQFVARDFPAAASNYWSVATNYAGVSGLTNSLAAQALYQIVRAGIETPDLDAAAIGLQRLIEIEPDGPHADRAALLIGQALSRRGNPPAARAVFADFASRFTNSVLLPEARLAVAQTYEREQAWPAAIQSYSNWLAAYALATNVPPDLVARAQFEIARLTLRTDPGTNALALLTNFVARQPASPDAPLAQYLVAEHAYRQGDYARAELLFQDRLLNQGAAALTGGLMYHARLMAGRAAIALRSFRSAREHFDWVITNGPLSVAASPIPTNIAAEAYLLRGDTFILEDGEAKTNTLERFGEAIIAFTKIAEQFPNSELAPAAWGRIGDCHFTLAAQDPKRFDRAAEAFRKVIESPAGVALRSQAEVKLATTLEKQAPLKSANEQAAQLDQALTHYLRVLYGQNLRAGELADPFWMKRAGLAAAELAEAMKRTDTAIGLYQRLLTELPVLRPRMEKRIAELEKSRSGTATSQ